MGSTDARCRFNDRPRDGDPGSKPGQTGRHPFHLTTLAAPPHGGAVLRRSPGLVSRPPGVDGEDSYLVDSASSHMLVSKIKPCMSKYKQLYGETANGSLNQLSFI